MKHPSSREFFAYWDDKRGSARAPERSEIEPSAVRELLGDIFVLSYDAAAGYPFRVAGTRVCALLGCDLKDRSFSALFEPEGRREIEPSAMRELLGDIFVLSYDAAAGYPFRVAGTRVCALLGCDLKDRSFSALFEPEGRREIEDIIAVVSEEMLAAVAGITATSQDGSRAHLELLLLPFNTRAHTPLTLTGLLAPFGNNHGVLGDFQLTSWRYLGHQPQKLLPRALRKLAVARGFMVYEGLR